MRCTKCLPKMQYPFGNLEISLRDEQPRLITAFAISVHMPYASKNNRCFCAWCYFKIKNFLIRFKNYFFLPRKFFKKTIHRRRLPD